MCRHLRAGKIRLLSCPGRGGELDGWRTSLIHTSICTHRPVWGPNITSVPLYLSEPWSPSKGHTPRWLLPSVLFPLLMDLDTHGRRRWGRVGDEGGWIDEY